MQQADESLALDVDGDADADAEALDSDDENEGDDELGIDAEESDGEWLPVACFTSESS